MYFVHDIIKDPAEGNGASGLQSRGGIWTPAAVAGCLQGIAWPMPAGVKTGTDRKEDE